jgi:predicted methyltransferase
MNQNRTVRLGALLSVAAVLCLASLAAAAGDPSDARLDALVAGPQRNPEAKARDPFRHPAEVLHFFGLADNQTVVEIWPGGAGFWTEILAPYLHDRGTYYAAVSEENSDEARKANAAFAAKLAAHPEIYGKVIVTTFGGDRHEIAPAGSADLIVTFRNLHNWMADHDAEAAFRAFFKALKPGGVLGIEDHRGRTDQPQDPEAKSGYVRQDYAIALAQAAGFKLAGASEVNANPKDTKDYPAGVWTLPPTYRLGATDRAKYEAIGESDRFVLKFVKPAG